jgi:DNA polymerase
MVSEISVVDPEIVVALGATAVRALLGPDARVQRDRGRLFEVAGSAPVVPTVHPSSILRAGGDEARRLATAAFVRDLRYVREVLDAG